MGRQRRRGHPEAADRLRAVIATCPSGALEIVEHQG
ncbi:(4Fe-4S)-binding protein [Tessaracoccus flavescens]